MKATIIYASVHHGNTKKVLNAMRKIKKFDLVKTSDCKKINFMDYDIIDFSAGSYACDFHKSNRSAIKLEGKVFLLYT